VRAAGTWDSRDVTATVCSHRKSVLNAEDVASLVNMFALVPFHTEVYDVV
jgi:hypothetical protein